MTDANPKTFYTCTDATSATSLLNSGASKMIISYAYEIDTPTILLSDGMMQDVLSEAVDRVQEIMLERIADRSGLLICGGKHPWRRRAERVEGVFLGRHRKLRRGGNSIVGLSSQPLDEEDATAQCTGSLTTLTNNDMTTDFAGVVEEEEGELMPISDNFSEISKRKNNNDLIETRNGRSDSTKNSNSNDNPDLDLDVSFNYISTQSLPQTRTSQSNPHTYVPAGSNLSSKFSPRMTSKCTVIHGHMSVFTDGATEYENLDGRIIDALTEDINTPMTMKELFLSDIVLGVRFLGVTGVIGAPESETMGVGTGYTDIAPPKETSSEGGDLDWMGTVTAIQGRPAGSVESSSSSSSFSGYSFPLLIFIALGSVFIVLVALFIYTAKPRIEKKRRRKYDARDMRDFIEEESHDYTEEGAYFEGEMEIGLDDKHFMPAESDYSYSSRGDAYSESDYSSSVRNEVTITSCHQEYGHEAQSEFVCTTPTRRKMSRGDSVSDYSASTSGDYSSSCGLNPILEDKIRLTEEEVDDYSIHSIHTANRSVRSKASPHSARTENHPVTPPRPIRSSRAACSSPHTSYSIHSIHTASPSEYPNTPLSVSTNSPSRKSGINPLAAVAFGRAPSGTGSLASQDSLSPSRLSKKRVSNPPSPSRLFLQRKSPMRYVGVPSTVDEDGCEIMARQVYVEDEDECESVAREAYVDEVDANEYDPNSAGVEISLAENFWRIGRVNSFV